MANPDDEIRDEILRYLYQVHRTSKGLKGVAIGIRDLQAAMKEEGIKREDLHSNLDYLLQKDWVREDVDRKTYTTPRGTRQESVTRKYKISADGMDRLQEASVFRREESFARINVTNVHGVTVIGTNNVVNTDMTDLSRNLTALESAIAQSTSLSDEDKLTVTADLATIQSQLSKQKPNTSVIKTVWGGIEKLVTGAEFATFVYEAGKLIHALPGL
jgi:TATA-binding protein-associated factor Taf7